MRRCRSAGSKLIFPIGDPKIAQMAGNHYLPNIPSNLFFTPSHSVSRIE